MKLRNLMVFAAILGVSLVGNVFADEQTTAEVSAVQSAEAAKDVVAKDAKEVKKVHKHKKMHAKAEAKEVVKTEEAKASEAPAAK
jgi:hypothetical protein